MGRLQSTLVGSDRWEALNALERFIALPPAAIRRVVAAVILLASEPWRLICDAIRALGCDTQSLRVLILRLAGPALCLLLVLQPAALKAQGSRNVKTSLLMVRVGEESQLQVSGNRLVLKMRLSPGVEARLWGDKACDIPTDEAIIIQNSGTYVIGLKDILLGNETYLCLLSSDGNLRNSLAVVQETN